MVRLQQVLLVLAGLVIASIMVALGLWQMGVYRSTGADSAQARAAAPPVALSSVAPPAVKITDGYGRTVSFAGTYDPALEFTTPTDASPVRRVVGGIRLDDGRLLAVIRGTTTGAAPRPPAGRVAQTGVLLPSEAGDPAGSSISVPLLAQTWPGQLVEGYVNLSADDARAQRLQPAPLDLPAEPGRLRNGAYALQWWLFAGFAIVLAVRIARDLDRGRDLELAAELDAAGVVPTEGGATAEEPSKTT
ncbi:SURF1 family protein [Microlunatus ginsengisoli]|uniref:SURF1-like protein n=1 Tax=Microlunatus ginsengisoli TaxID=363863 RepID=A0ABP7A107_9ACTN